MSTASTPAPETAAAGAPAANPTYDIVVIGGGPGGYVAAIRAAQLGLKAAVVEREELGGICLNWGCIPSKTLLRNAEVLSLINRADSFGISVGNVSADYGAGMARCRKVVTTQVRGVNFLMRKNQIDVVRGAAKVLGRDRVAVSGGADGDRELQTKNVIIATGSRVRQLKGVDVDGQHVISAKEMWNVDSLPKSILIIGSGAIGVEFATIFQAYGTEVTLVEFLPRVLPLEDEEISTELARSFSRRGIKIMTSTSVDGVDVSGDTVKVHLSPAPGGRMVEVEQWQEPAQQERTTQQGETQPQTLEVERVLLAAGFQPNSGDLGLEVLGVTINQRGFIGIDDRMQTNVPGIYAIGDVTGKVPLAHVASAQGEVAAEAIAGHPEITLDYNAMPRCTYSNPQVASMGLTEAQAREGGREVRVGKFPFRPNGKAQALNELDGQIKIIADAASGEILGVQMIGADVTELIGEFSLARSLESTPFELARSVHPHPTLSEVIAEAALNVEGHAIHM